MAAAARATVKPAAVSRLTADSAVPLKRSLRPGRIRQDERAGSGTRPHDAATAASAESDRSLWALA